MEKMRATKGEIDTLACMNHVSPQERGLTQSGFRSLIVWRRAMDLARAVYLVGRLLPPDERFGLSQQLRRAGVSVPANIAEGNGRLTHPQYLHFLSIANGSLMEIETLLILAYDLGFVSQQDIARPLALRAEVGRRLGGLIRRLRALRASQP
jgi:four helix bundle protein